MLWAEANLSVHPLSTCSYDEFLGEFKKTFVHPVAEGGAEERLLGLQQGDRSIAEFIIDFRTTATEANWPKQALRRVFRRVLNDELKDQLASLDEPETFEYNALSLRIDNRLREREAKKKRSVRKPAYRAPSIFLPCPSLPVTGTSAGPAANRADAPEPMHIGCSHLTPEEIE